MFGAAKGLEVLLGIALILNRHAVLALVIAFPVMLMTFLLDLIPFVRMLPAFAAGEVSAAALWAGFLDMLFFGGGVIVMQAYLMSAWFDHYRPLFSAVPGGKPAAWSRLFGAASLTDALLWLSLTVGAASTLWMIGLATRIIPWSSLALLAPPR